MSLRERVLANLRFAFSFGRTCPSICCLAADLLPTEFPFVRLCDFTVLFRRIDDWLAYDVRDRDEDGLRRARNNGKKDVRIHAHPIDAERVVGRPVLTHTKHFSGHVVVKSNSLAVPSGGDTKQRLLEWMVRPGRPSSKLWYLSARWKRAALSLGSRPEFRILESHFTFASGSPPPSLSFSQSVLQRPVVSLTFVTITRIAKQLSMISREIRGFVRFLRN